MPAPARPTALATCNLCGGTVFGAGPGGRKSSTGLAPCCHGCGALERHRAAAQVMHALAPACLDGSRALLVGAEQAVAAIRFAHCDQVAAPVGGSFVIEDELDRQGSYDFIGLIHVLEYVDDDRRDFERLLRLLSPKGMLQAVFADADARPWTSIRAGGRGSVRRLYGRDVLTHFRGPAPLHLTVREGADPVTGVVQQVHFFYRDPRRHAALASI